MSWFGCKEAPKPERSVLVSAMPAGAQVGIVAADAAGAVFGTTAGLQVSSKAAAPAALTPAGDAAGMGALALDSSRVYFTRLTEVFAVPRTGGAAVQLSRDEAGPISGIAVDGEAVYWAVDGRAAGTGSNSRNSPAKPALLRKAPKAGGEPVTLASFKHARSYAGLVQDESHLYFATAEGLFRAAKSGGQPEKVLDVAGEVTSLSIDGGFLYFTIAWVAVGGGDVRRVATKGGPVEVVVPEDHILAATADATGLYWLTPKKLMTLPKGGAAPVQLDQGLGLEEAALAVAADAVYWTDKRRLWRAPR